MLFINAETITFKTNGIVVKIQKTLYFFYVLFLKVDIYTIIFCLLFLMFVVFIYLPKKIHFNELKINFI